MARCEGEHIRRCRFPARAPLVPVRRRPPNSASVPRIGLPGEDHAPRSGSPALRREPRPGRRQSVTPLERVARVGNRPKPGGQDWRGDATPAALGERGRNGPSELAIRRAAGPAEPDTLDKGCSAHEWTRTGSSTIAGDRRGRQTIRGSAPAGWLGQGQTPAHGRRIRAHSRVGPVTFAVCHRQVKRNPHAPNAIGCCDCDRRAVVWLRALGDASEEGPVDGDDLRGAAGWASSPRAGVVAIRPLRSMLPRSSPAAIGLHEQAARRIRPTWPIAVAEQLTRRARHSVCTECQSNRARRVLGTSPFGDPS